jgi:hypothetical protein
MIEKSSYKRINSIDYIKDFSSYLISAQNNESFQNYEEYIFYLIL